MICCSRVFNYVDRYTSISNSSLQNVLNCKTSARTKFRNIRKSEITVLFLTFCSLCFYARNEKILEGAFKIQYA